MAVSCVNPVILRLAGDENAGIAFRYPIQNKLKARSRTVIGATLVAVTGIIRQQFGSENPVPNSLPYHFGQRSLCDRRAKLGGDQLEAMFCHNSAATNLDKCPTFVVAMTTSGTPRVIA